MTLCFVVIIAALMDLKPPVSFLDEISFKFDKSKIFFKSMDRGNRISPEFEYLKDKDGHQSAKNCFYN